MAGHSKFKNIQHRKGAQDKKRAKLFTKVLKNIIVAAKQGAPNPDSNSKLRHAIAAAKKLNIPKDRIDNAIKQITNPTDQDQYDEMRYEGFASGGIAIIVEALTDNRNRTASAVRSTFSKYAGNLGETGSVSFMFDHVGIITYKAQEVKADSDKIMQIAIESGALDVVSEDDEHTFYTEIENFSEVLDNIVKELGDPEESYIGWRPKNLVSVDDEDKCRTLFKLVDTLEDLDDVQRVFGNYEVPDHIYQKLLA